MPDTSRKRPRRKKKARGALFAPLAFLIICATLVFAMSVFFRVSRISVTGNALYSEEEITTAAGIEKGDNLFFINRFTAIARIRARLPYIEEVTIERALPNRVTITVSESKAIAYVTAETGCWVIDRGCKLLTQATPEEMASLIRVDGITPIAPSVGDQVAAGDADAPKVTYLSQILDQIQQRGMEGDVTYIDVSTSANPSFDYLQRFTVKLGSMENTEYKFGILLSAVSQLTAGDTGTIDLSIDKRAHFSPE